MRPPEKAHVENWPKCAFFGVFDGHGGASCADFLRDNLHQFVGSFTHIHRLSATMPSQRIQCQLYEVVSELQRNISLKLWKNSPRLDQG
jgi:serine/threonine protein phosphatase PrpC